MFKPAKLLKNVTFGKNKGFTLIELFVVMAILAIVFGLSTPYLFGHREKILLQTEQEKITYTLRDAQQRAIAARRGYDQVVEFNLSANQYTHVQEGRTTAIHEKISIESVSPQTITFARLTGKPDSAFSLTLISDRFRCRVAISSEGVITATKPENL